MTQDNNTIEASGIKENDFLVVTIIIKKKPAATQPPKEEVP